MRILYLDQYFSNREGISGTRGYEFARRWVAEGHQVTVLTSVSRYSHLAQQTKTRFIQRQKIEGFEVVSVPVNYAQQMGVAARLRSFFAYVFWAALIGVFSARHDVVLATSTPLTIGLPGTIISRLRGTPFVFEVRDLWPRAPIELGQLRSPLAQALARAAERFFYRAAAAVIALSTGMAEGVAAAGMPPAKITMIPNSCDFDLFEHVSPIDARRELGIPEDAVTFIHAGNLGPSNDGQWLVELAAQWQKKNRSDLWIVLLGEGSERPALELRAHELGLIRLIFAGPVTRRKAAEIIKACDVGIVSFADYPVLRTNSPNKFFDYLAAGLPVAVNTAGWTAELLHEASAGILASRNITEAAAQLAELADDSERRRQMGQAARRLAERFDRKLLSSQMLGVLAGASQAQVCGLEPVLKRLTDLLGSGLFILIFWPLLAALAWAIKRDSAGPVFYRPERVGRDGRRFRLWKFRTMVVDAERIGLGLNVAENDSRITRVGKFLREWTLDELPQVFNIFHGEMSLVGPRPALSEHIERYNPQQHRRLFVRPGLTGLAQISGRNLLTWDEKLAKDLEYVATWSWWGDIKIIFRTIGVVLRREGLYEPGAGLDDRFNKFENGDHKNPDA